jgi:peptidoglycan hydrolase-like protein with peptidoglycan-binding domain
VRSAERASRAAAFGDGDLDERRRRWLRLPTLGWGRADIVLAVIGVIATAAILVNVVFLQSGPHPGPLLKTAIVEFESAAKKEAKALPAALPRARPMELAAAKPDTTSPAGTTGTARSTADIITDIQRELTRRGFYDGALDGRYGPRTDAAIRDFEQAAGLKPSTDANEALLKAITRSSPKVAKPGQGGGATIRAAPVRNNDPIAELLAPSKRVLAVQRALAEYGYGQLKPTGVLDAETQAAIEKFERLRKLPVTGQLSERLTRELAVVSGRPLE